MKLFFAAAAGGILLAVATTNFAAEFYFFEVGFVAMATTGIIQHSVAGKK